MNKRNFCRGVIDKVTSLFTGIYKRLHEICLNLFVAKKDEYYSYKEPSSKKMKNKTYWIQIIDKED